MGCESPKQAILFFRQMMQEMDMKNPVAGNRIEEIEVLSHSVNPVRLKNNPIGIDISAAFYLYGLVLTGA
jgi:hypothetical protein